MRFLLALLLCGCAMKPLTAPQSGAVDSNLSRVKSSATTAEAQRSDIATHGARAKSDLQRAEDKEILATRYREYRKAHPKP